MKNIIYFLIAFLFICGNLSAQKLSLDEVMQASCRITSHGGRTGVFGNASTEYGSGIVISESDSEYFILTNGHVIANNSNIVLVDFFHNGHKSALIKARVQWVRFNRNTTIDAALLAVSKVHFKKVKPIVVPLADKNIALKSGDYVYGAGCPNGYWNQAWEGRVVQTEKNITHINAPPVEGQSGSAMLADVLDNKGKVNTRIVGLITWRLEDKKAGQKSGGAVSLSRLHELFIGTPARDKISASFSYPSGYKQEEVCGECGHPLSKHMIVPDGKGGILRYPSGQARLFCPGSVSAINSGIQTSNIVCNVCPPGGCIHMPWSPPTQNQLNYPPAEPAPISPNGIWTMPDQDIKNPNDGWIGYDEKRELENKVKELSQQLLDKENKNLSLGKTIDELTKNLGLTEEQKSSLEKEIQEKSSAINGLNKSVADLGSERTNLLGNLSELNKKLGLTDQLLGEKSDKYDSLLDKFVTTSSSNEELVIENNELSRNNNVKNVSLTLAGAGTTAGIWFLKSYVLPAVVGGLRKRRKNKKNGGSSNVDSLNYGTVPDSVLNNRHDTSQDVGVVDKGHVPLSFPEGPYPQPQPPPPETIMPPSQLPAGQPVNELFNRPAGQLSAWDNYAAYGQQQSPMVTGLDPGSPFGVPFMKKQATAEQIMVCLSEISNEYANDYTMTPGHTMTLLRQKLKVKFGIDY